MNKINEPNRLRIFVSYTRADYDKDKQLFKHLKLLERNLNVEFWHDQKINPGDEWRPAIQGEISQCEAFICLVSVDYLNSNICIEELNKAKKQNKKIIPIIVRECGWKDFKLNDESKLGCIQYTEPENLDNYHTGF